MKLDIIQEFLEPGAVVLEGLSEAIEGYSDQGQLVYEYDKMLDCLVKNSEGVLTLEDAREWVEFNVLPLQALDSGFVMLHRVTEQEA